MLESPDQTSRRPATYYDATQVGLRLDFSAAYSGTLHLYALDWDNIQRGQRITVNDGSGDQVVNITTDFSQGAWTHFSINVLVGGVVTINVQRTAGPNAVLAGLFLGPVD